MFNLRDIYEGYKQDVFVYLVSLTHNPSLSEDLVSETFLAAIKSLPKFKGDSSIKTWLFAIARNKWYEHLRKKNNDIYFEDLAEIYLREKENIEQLVINKAIEEKIMELLNAENKRTKTIVLMRIEGYSFYEIASRLKISESSARVIDFRARKKIKQALEKEGLGYG